LILTLDRVPQIKIRLESIAAASPKKYKILVMRYTIRDTLICKVILITCHIELALVRNLGIQFEGMKSY